MKRRLSIAMALISNPKILFLDEPTLGLDVRARRELWQVILDLKKNTTIILTTHYLEEAKVLADRIGVLNKGKLVKVGTFNELALATGKDDIEEIFLALTGDLCNE
jgi:ABC-2 type transport system ATP-binding protein